MRAAVSAGGRRKPWARTISQDFALQQFCLLCLPCSLRWSGRTSCNFRAQQYVCRWGICSLPSGDFDCSPGMIFRALGSRASCQQKGAACLDTHVSGRTTPTRLSPRHWMKSNKDKKPRHAYLHSGVHFTRFACSEKAVALKEHGFSRADEVQDPRALAPKRTSSQVTAAGVFPEE